MSWVFVGVGAAVGAGAGAAIGSEKGGDDVWKGALLGGALGAAGGAGAYALGPGAAAALPEAAPVVATPATAAVVPSAAGAAPAVAAPTATTGIFGGVAPTITGEVGAYGAGIGGIGGTTAPIAAPTTASGSLSAGQGLFAVPEVTSPTTASVAPQITGNATWNLGTVGGAEAQPGAYMASKEAAMSPLQSAFNSMTDWMGENKFLTAGLGYMGLKASGLLDNQNEGQPFGTNTQTAAGYPMSPSFKPSREDPEKYRYTARYAAEGGIMGYAPGGMVQQDPMNPIQNPIYPQSQQQQTNFATSTQYPNSMKSAMASDYDARTNPMTGQEMPMGMAEGGVAHFRKGGTNYSEMAAEFAAMSDRRLGAKSPGSRSFQTRDFPSVESTGVYRDTDPATRYKNAVDAAIYQNAALAKKYDVGGPQLKVPSGGLGSINMGPMDKEKKGTSGDAEEDFAAGGISTLGGYAHGGNPRLLRGPGDGMSDDIPATIAGRQPARLADGEFVVPADVVSALGNGSTEAGAKHLHAMMDRARQKAHGKKTQMKKVNAKKVLPA